MLGLSVLKCFSLSYVSIWNKPAWFMVMWKMPRNGMVWHVSRTNLNTYMHLIVYILCTPTYLFSSIFINIYYENESNSNRMVSHCWLQLMFWEEKIRTKCMHITCINVCSAFKSCASTLSWTMPPPLPLQPSMVIYVTVSVTVPFYLNALIIWLA